MLSDWKSNVTIRRASACQSMTAGCGSPREAKRNDGSDCSHCTAPAASSTLCASLLAPSRDVKYVFTQSTMKSTADTQSCVLRHTKLETQNMLMIARIEQRGSNSRRCINLHTTSTQKTTLHRVLQHATDDNTALAGASGGANGRNGGAAALTAIESAPRLNCSSSRAICATSPRLPAAAGMGV